MIGTRSTALGPALAIAVALLITLGYFALTGNWTNLGNPIASIVALLAGVIGFAAGQLPRAYARRRRATPLPADSGQ